MWNLLWGRDSGGCELRENPAFRLASGYCPSPHRSPSVHHRSFTTGMVSHPPPWVEVPFKTFKTASGAVYQVQRAPVLPVRPVAAKGLALMLAGEPVCFPAVA